LRPTRRSWPSPRTSTPSRPSAPAPKIFTLDLTNPAAKPVKVSTSAGGNFNPAYSPDGKYIAWRSQARAGYESDKFRLVLYDRAAKTIKDLLPKFDNWVDEFAWAPDSKSDKTKVQGFIIRPPGFDPAKKYPVKFLIHGGPQGAWGD
jgi:dipeptidyl aminopeptidase/acylaminoacyl peptidase